MYKRQFYLDRVRVFNTTACVCDKITSHVLCMAAMMSFHEEKCGRLMSVHTASAQHLCSSSRQFLIYNTFVLVIFSSYSSIFRFVSGISSFPCSLIVEAFGLSPVLLNQVSVAKQLCASEYRYSLSIGLFIMTVKCAAAGKKKIWLVRPIRRLFWSIHHRGWSWTPDLL